MKQDKVCQELANAERKRPRCGDCRRSGVTLHQVGGGGWHWLCPACEAWWDSVLDQNGDEGSDE